MKRLTMLAVGIAMWLTSPTKAADLVDCPLRDELFSLSSPLVDILLSPTAMAAIEHEQPNFFKGLPPFFLSDKAPSFSTILTLEQAATIERMTPDRLAALKQTLAVVPVTDADRIARCTRYDTNTPDLAIPAGHPKLLLFEKINGFRDGPSVAGAHNAFLDIGRRKGWAIVTTENGGAFQPNILRQFDAIIWNNVSGDVLTLSQRSAFRAYIEGGGGFVGVHGTGGDPVYFWDWYADTLIGARFAGHPLVKQFQTARVRLDDVNHPVSRGLPSQWDMYDEWYSFKNNPRNSGSDIIATLDEKTYDPTGAPGQDLSMGDHPIAWTRCVGRGRIFYSAIGHRPERYADPIYVQMLEQAIAWSAGLNADVCRTYAGRLNNMDASPSAKAPADRMADCRIHRQR